MLLQELLDLIWHVEACNKDQDFLEEASAVCVVVQIIQIITELLIAQKQTTEDEVNAYLKIILNEEVLQPAESLLNHWHI